MAMIKSFSAKDSTGASNIGALGDVVTVTLNLDEALTATNATVNATTVLPSFQVGADSIAASAISFVSYNPSAKTMVYQLTIPSGLTLAPLTLTGLTVSPEITLTGKLVKGVAATLQTREYNLRAAYTIDSISPVFTSPATPIPWEENKPTREALYTATATDNNGAVSYRLSGTDAGFFNIDKQGAIRFKANPDFERQTLYQLNVIASDRSGNSQSQALSVTLNNIDEAVTLRPGLKGTGIITVAKGDLSAQAKSILSDFVNDMPANRLSFVSSNSLISIDSNGRLSGTIASKGTIRFTVESSDGVDNTLNGKIIKDVSRSYQLIVLDSPTITSLSVSDADRNNSGKQGDVVNLKVGLSEAIQSPEALTSISAIFSVGRTPLGNISFTGASNENAQGTLNFTATLPAGDSRSIALTSLNLNSNTLIGTASTGTLKGNFSKLNLQGAYSVDNSAPRFTSPATVTVNENITSALYTASARDNSSVTYSLSGNQASLFNIDANNGRVTVKANMRLDYEALKDSSYRTTLNIIATDAAGNSASRPITINVRNVEEPTQLNAGAEATLTNFTLYKDISASHFIRPISEFIRDPEGKKITYRLSDGILPRGLTLNAESGAITGKILSSETATSYSFAVLGDDGINNGVDASRRYSGSISNQSLLVPSDTLLTISDSASTVSFTAYGNFPSGTTITLFKAVATPAAATAVSPVETITQDSDTHSFDISKSALLSDNSTASFFVRYTPAGGTATDSLSVNIRRDETAPSVSAISLTTTDANANGFLRAGGVVTATATFSEAVALTGTPTLSLMIGSTAKAMTFASATATTARFTYTIQASDNDSNGISVAANAFSNLIYRDLVDNTGTTTNPTVADLTGLKVDTTPPTPAVISFVDTGTSPTDNITNNGNVTVSNLEAGATWHYRINNAATWTPLTSTQFTATPGVTTYQVRQIDQAGNSSLSEVKTIDYRRLALGFLISGFSVNDGLNGNVSSAGDVNGDGLTDLIVGLPYANGYKGKSFVVFGKKDASTINLTNVDNGTGGFVINGVSGSGLSGDESGYSVSTAGDFDGDGLADLIVGAPKVSISNVTSVGRSYLILGKTSNEAVNLSALANGSGGFVINGETSSSSNQSGYAVSALGDINRDGLADVMISTYLFSTATKAGVGRTYVVFGKTDKSNIELSAIANGNGGFVLTGDNVNEGTGRSISSAGDVNGDGLLDLVVTTSSFGGFAGRCYVVYGQATLSNINLANIANGTGGFAIDGQTPDGAFGEQSGTSVSAGDVNGDGLSDLIIGAPNSNPLAGTGAGRTYVLFGRTAMSAINLADVANGTGGFVINGQITDDKSGQSVANAGDVNGDGFADILIGALKADTVAGGDAGRSYVVFGKNNNSAVDLAAVANGTGGFVINGSFGSGEFGRSVSAAGDVNGDGLADLIAFEPRLFTITQSLNPSRSYVIFGKTDTKSINLADINVGAGDSIDYFNTPTSGGDTPTGTTAAEILFGAAGDDTITGGGGADVLLGGSGNDLIVVNGTNISALSSGVSTKTVALSGLEYNQLARIDGGTGIDTLRLTGGASIDFTQITQIAASNPKVGSRVSSIERIDLATDTAANTVKISLFDVLDMAGMNLFNTSSGSGWTGTGLGTSVVRHQVVITGSNTDTVDIDGFSTAGGAANVWTKQMSGGAALTVSNGGVTFEIWNHNTAAAQLLIQTGVIVS